MRLVHWASPSAVKPLCALSHTHTHTHAHTHTHTPSAVAEQPCHDATAALLCPIGKVERKIKKDCYSSSLKCSKCAFREALISTLIPPKGGREHLTANVPIHGLSCIV